MNQPQVPLGSSRTPNQKKEGKTTAQHVETVTVIVVDRKRTSPRCPLGLLGNQIKKEGKTTAQHVETAVEIQRAAEQQREEGEEEETEK